MVHSIIENHDRYSVTKSESWDGPWTGCSQGTRRLALTGRHQEDTVDTATAFYTADEIEARLSISTLVFRGYRPIGERTLEELARHGLTRIELLESREQFDMEDSKSMAHIARACRSTGVAVGSYHAHQTTFSDVGTESERQARVDVCRRQIDTMLELGGTVWGCHAQDADEVVTKSYEELLAHVEGTAAVLTVENFMRPGVGVTDRVAFLDAVDHPQLGMILDIGHVRDGDGQNPMTVPGGPTATLGLCGHRLRHVHLHGFMNGRDHHPPMVEGDGIEWVELFRALRAAQYGADMNFEPQGDPIHADTLEYTARAPERIVAMAAAEA